MELVSFFSLVQSLLKANLQLKRTKNHMKNEKLRRNWNARGISSGPWWTLPGLLSRFPNASFCAFALNRDLCHGSTVLGLYWASFPSILDLVWPHLLDFLLTFGSICISLQSEPKQVETKRNWRNIGINCNIMQINHKIEFKSFKIPMHIWHLPTRIPQINLGKDSKGSQLLS